jgi:pimeloyl-ACP methyl ester carboxylesterase
MAFTAQYPKKVRKLILADVGPSLDPRGVKRISQEIINVPEEFDSFEAVVDYMGKQNRYASDVVLRRRLQHATKELSNGKVGWRYDLLIREQRRQGTTPPLGDMWPVVRNIACPTLIVRGADSDVLSPEIAARALEAIPNSQLVEVPLASHMVVEDNPGEFLAAVRRYLS